MLLNFHNLVQKYGIPKGIIHIGAHQMQEREIYVKHGLENTIWIEANPAIVNSLSATVNLFEQEQLYNFAITDEDIEFVNFHIASFDQSSSLLKMSLHEKYYPSISMVNTILTPAKRIDKLIQENKIQIQNYNFINLDIQGAELKALHSFGTYLANFDFIYTEVNVEPLYENCCLLPDLEHFLQQSGFKRVETQMSSAKWGDAFFIKA